MKSETQYVGGVLTRVKPPHPRRCEVCRHFELPEGAQESGKCLANYPVLIPLQGNLPGTMGAVSMFPPMKPHERCGKWMAGKVPSMAPHEAAPHRTD